MRIQISHPKHILSREPELTLIAWHQDPVKWRSARRKFSAASGKTDFVVIPVHMIGKSELCETLRDVITRLSDRPKGIVRRTWLVTPPMEKPAKPSGLEHSGDKGNKRYPNEWDTNELRGAREEIPIDYCMT